MEKQTFAATATKQFAAALLWFETYLPIFCVEQWEDIILLLISISETALHGHLFLDSVL